jgi:hypothetical protein
MPCWLSFPDCWEVFDDEEVEVLALDPEVVDPLVPVLLCPHGGGGGGGIPLVWPPGGGGGGMLLLPPQGGGGAIPDAPQEAELPVAVVPLDEVVVVPVEAVVVVPEVELVLSAALT